MRGLFPADAADADAAGVAVVFGAALDAAGLGAGWVQLVTVHEVAEGLEGLRRSSKSSRGSVDERLEVWARCCRLFAVHKYPHVLAAVFLLTVSAQMEGDISLTEQAFLLAAALSLLGSPHPAPARFSSREALLQHLVQCAQGSCSKCGVSSNGDSSSSNSGGLTLVDCLPLQPEEMRSVFWIGQAEASADAAAEEDGYCCCSATATDSQLADPFGDSSFQDCCCRCMVSSHLLAQLQGRLLLLLTSQSTTAAAAAALTPELAGNLWGSHVAASTRQLLLHGAATPLKACSGTTNVQQLLQQLQQLVDPDAPALPLHYIGVPQWTSPSDTDLDDKDIQQQRQQQRGGFDCSEGLPGALQGRTAQAQSANKVLLQQLQKAVHNAISIGCTHIARALVGSFVTLLRSSPAAASVAAASAISNTKSAQEDQQRKQQQLLQGLSQEVQLAELLIRVVSLPMPLRAQQQQLVLLQTLSAAAAAACAATRPGVGPLPQLHRELLQMLHEHVGSPDTQVTMQQRQEQRPQQQEGTDPQQDNENEQQHLLSLQMHRQQLQLLSQLVQRCKPGLHPFCLELLILFAVSLVLVSSFNEVLQQQQQQPQALLLRLLLAAAFPTCGMPKPSLCIRFAEKLTRDRRLQQQEVAAVLLAAFVAHQQQFLEHVQNPSQGQEQQQHHQQQPQEQHDQGQEQQRIIWFEWPLLILKDFLRICGTPGLVGEQALQMLLQQDELEMDQALQLGKPEGDMGLSMTSVAAPPLLLLHEQQVELSLLAYYDLERACNAAGLAQLLELLQRRLAVYMQLGKPYLLLRVLTSISPSPHFKPAMQ